jgi:hypothetical protein
MINELFSLKRSIQGSILISFKINSMNFPVIFYPKPFTPPAQWNLFFRLFHRGSIRRPFNWGPWDEMGNELE